jgi:hypothetical protein
MKYNSGMKHSFLVTLAFDGDVKATPAAKLIREELTGQEIYSGTDKNRKAVRVKKVTVTGAGEK